MISNLQKRSLGCLAALAMLLASCPAFSQTHDGKKIYIITDMEGVDGVFNWPDQCSPFVSPRWKESQKLLTDEANAAVEGLYAGGATDVVVADLHDNSRSLSVLTIDPRAKLLQGQKLPPDFGINSSYSAVIFIGQHAMAGAKNAVLAHSYSFTVQNLWVNDNLIGEIGGSTMLAGYYNVPVIMLAGDEAACEELHGLVPNAECAVVKWGLSWGGGISLSHQAACDLIRQKAQAAMEHLTEYKPYKIDGPVTIKEQNTVETTPGYWPHPKAQSLDERTHTYVGKDYMEAWIKWRTGSP